MNTDTDHPESLQPFKPHLYAAHFQTSGRVPQARVNVIFWSGYDVGHGGKAEASSWLSRPHQLPRSRTHKNCPGKTQVAKLFGRCTASYGCRNTPNTALRQRSEGWSSTARAWALWTEWSNRSAETRKWATAGAKAQGEGEICHGPHHATSANARPHRQQWSRKNPKGIHSEAFSRNFCRSQ